MSDGFDTDGDDGLAADELPLEDDGLLTAEDFDDERETELDDELDDERDDELDDELDDGRELDDEREVDVERELPRDCAYESNWKAANANAISIAEKVFADNLIVFKF